VDGSKQGKAKKEEPKRRRSPKSKSEARNEDEEGLSGGRRSRESGINYAKFILEADVAPSDAYDSDQDPCFVPRMYHDPDLDYDEYSDGEISEGEASRLFSATKLCY
jgi:hypothetical protein